MQPLVFRPRPRDLGLQPLTGGVVGDRFFAHRVLLCFVERRPRLLQLVVDLDDATVVGRELLQQLRLFRFELEEAALHVAHDHRVVRRANLRHALFGRLHELGVERGEALVRLGEGRLRLRPLRLEVGELAERVFLFGAGRRDAVRAREVLHALLRRIELAARKICLLGEELEGAGRALQREVLLEVNAEQRVEHAPRLLRVAGPVADVDQPGFLDGRHREIAPEARQRQRFCLGVVRRLARFEERLVESGDLNRLLQHVVGVNELGLRQQLGFR